MDSEKIQTLKNVKNRVRSKKDNLLTSSSMDLLIETLKPYSNWFFERSQKYDLLLPFFQPEICRGSCHPWPGGFSARWQGSSIRTGTTGWRGGQPLLLQTWTNESTVLTAETNQRPVSWSRDQGRPIRGQFGQYWPISGRITGYLRESSIQRRSISHSIKS